MKESFQAALEIGHCTELINEQAVQLVEHCLMRCINCLITVDLSRHNCAYRRLSMSHDANLHRRGLRAQQYLSRYNPEGILHVPRWVIGREIERLEVVVISLYLRSL